MINLIPPEGATEEQLDAFVASLRKDARMHVRELLAAGTPEMEIADYIASLEPTEEDSITPTNEGGKA
ncbi:MAG TPA: hypothetical protein VMW11_02445 [Candidatus Dormibacteraeota bacterium]|nr:hypothetical protein [Candidatus Dormibacteraeota bacterium]